MSGKAVFLDRHLNRMRYSADIFSIPFPIKDLDEVKKSVEILANECGPNLKARLTIFRIGETKSDWMLAASELPAQRNSGAASSKPRGPNLLAIRR